MENFKKELFKKEYNTEFPFYYELKDEECIKMKNDIIRRYQIQGKYFDNDLSEKQFFFDKLNAEDENFNFLNLVKELSLKEDNSIYVTWNSFINVDKFSTKDFFKYFTDIWYPIADDIDITNQNLSWIISIRHDGAISYIKL